MSLLRSASVFAASAFIVGGFTVGAVRLGHRAAPASHRRPAAAAPAFSAPAKSVGELSEQLRRELLSGEECDAALSRLSHADLLQLLRAQDAGFWSSNPNAALALHEAGLLLGRALPADAAMAEVRAVLEPLSLPDPVGRRLLCAAFGGVLEARSLSTPVVVSLLWELNFSDALALVESWLDFQAATSPRSDFAAAQQMLGEVFPEAAASQTAEIQVMIVRLWAHRAPPPGDALLFAANVEEVALQHRLIAEGVRWLAVANPGELEKRVTEFAPGFLRDAAGILYRSGWSFESARRAAAGMAPKTGSQFVEMFVRQFRADDPREMARFAERYPLKDLPPGAQATIVNGLAECGDYQRVDDLLAGLPPADADRLLSGIFTPFGDEREATGRYYLEKRARDGKAGFWPVRAALGTLPPDEADRWLQTVIGLDANSRKQIQEEVDLRRVRTAVEEAPERFPELLNALPPERRPHVLAYAWPSGIDEPALLSWIDAAADPRLRMQIQNRAVQDAVGRGDLDGASRLTARFLQGVAKPENYASVCETVIKALASTDSARTKAFVEGLPAGKLRDQAMEAAVAKWSETDPVSASEWVAQQPPGPARDKAVMQLVGFARDDPENALANAAGIQERTVRLAAARSVVRAWREAGPEKIAALLTRSGFPAEDLPILRAMLGSQTGISPAQ